MTLHVQRKNGQHHERKNGQHLNVTFILFFF
uniref:Uncharacterized protein n=1 Tax=Arundo donax TaxID=35708 RepID=A0A0A9BG00_ARUDO